ncbi:MAG: hypothetical protein ABIQ84_10115 [Usitatibacter sp.]
MNVISEFAPLLAAAAPVLMIAVINACLALQGERDTLLFPSFREFPTATAGELEDLPSTEPVQMASFESANDDMACKAA